MEGNKPNIDYFKVWGCIAYFRTPDPKRTKLGSRAVRSIFVGYASRSKAYRLLDLETNIISESRDVEFFENKFSKDSIILPERGGSGSTSEQGDSASTPEQGGSGSTERLDTTDRLIESGELAVQTPLNEPRRSTRARKEKELGEDFISPDCLLFLVEGNQDNKILNETSYSFHIDTDP